METKASTAGAPAALEPPITREQLHEHVLTVLMVFGRILDFVFPSATVPDAEHKKIHAILYRDPALRDLDGFDLTAAEIGLSYERISHIAFAQEMEDLYDLAYYGQARGDTDSESGASWSSRLVYDLGRSQFVAEFHQYSPCQEAFAALLTVCETAMARMALEDEFFDSADLFMDWHVGALNGLTFRQLALLSGMTEPSLRTIASRDRERLPVKTEGRNAYIEPPVAREWLKSKDKYVPVRHAGPRDVTAMDLSLNGIKHVADLLNRIDRRAAFFLEQEDERVAERFASALAAISPPVVFARADGSHLMQLEDDDRLLDEALTGQLAAALELPKEPFVLKCAQLRIKSRLADVERRLTQAAAIKS